MGQNKEDQLKHNNGYRELEQAETKGELVESGCPRVIASCRQTIETHTEKQKRWRHTYIKGSERQ